MEAESSNPEEKSLEPKKSWIQKYSESSKADWWLATFSFSEASFFPVPPSTLMIAIMSTKDKFKNWFYYGSLTTAFSVLGGLFGYLIGFLFYDSIGQVIIEAYDLTHEITQVGEMFQNNAFFSIFLAAFTPIPYKVFTLASGFFKIDPFVFIFASLLGRGLRFYAVAIFVRFLGKYAPKKALKYLNYFAAFIAVVAIGYFLYKLLDFTVF